MGWTGSSKIKILNRCLELTPKGLVYKADPRHGDLLVVAFNFAESSGVGTPDGENEASKSQDTATFSVGETEKQEIDPCSKPREASGSVHMTRDSWADESTDERRSVEMTAARLTSQKRSVCAV